MDIHETISKYFQTQPIEKAWLFGSHSRGEATPQSDVDILVRFSPDSKITLFGYARMVNDLERMLDKKVDLVEDGQLADFTVESVERDKKLIYERTTERQG